MMSVIKSIYGKLLDWAGLANVPAAVAALGRLKGSVGQLVKISSVDEDGVVTGVEAAGSQNANGLTTTAQALLITILRAANYDTDQSANITALEAALASSGGAGDSSGGDTEAATYTVTNNLSNVTSSNSATVTAENAAYSATLTAADGYVLSTVVVSMGGVDVTDTVYNNGYITIAQVTGNVVITATATASTAQTEELTNIVYIGGWPELNEAGEWEYTEQTVAGLYVAFLPGELYGGKLKIEYNTEDIPGFDISVRTSTADGMAAHCSSGSVPNVTWVVAGESAYTGSITTSPTTYDIPDGERPMIILRRGSNEGPEINSNALFCQWVKNGGVKCTITTGEEA